LARKRLMTTVGREEQGARCQWVPLLLNAEIASREYEGAPELLEDMIYLAAISIE
jgi:hypothetical protein